MRLIDCDALKKEWSMADRCEDCPQKVIACQYDQVFTRMDICQMLDDAPTVGGWISVKDRLPDDGMTGKLVYDTANGVHICSEAVTIQFPDGKTRISSDRKLVEWMFANWDRTKPMPDDITHITHWMPLPEAPHDAP